jgi:peroxiredoxin
MDSSWTPASAAEQVWLRHWVAGPQRTRWTELPPQSGDKAPALDLTDENGNTFSLSVAWSNGPAVLIFLRHFGCGCAWERAQRLAGELDTLTAAGATVLAIGQGDPARTRSFKERTGLRCAILSDEDRRAYEAFGLLDARPAQAVYGMGEAFLRRDLKAAMDFIKSRQGSGRGPVDSPWQLPGEFVIDDRGVITLAYRSQYCADYADPDVLTAAITEAKLKL